MFFSKKRELALNPVESLNKSNCDWCDVIFAVGESEFERDAFSPFYGKS